eukprot:TRINITY_DN1127_c0_g2_i1.p1 TRINITY_DN1127_c0_g2~~TRINITY_DN1127_c0_g2_i1.p1  ORF type:complete len:326 (+),score=113.56 TRINITY_DN1127_c0_g2_i1:193-1170(+)
MATPSVSSAGAPAGPAACPRAQSFCPGEAHRQLQTVSAEYMLGEEIGEGAYARVVEAKHLETGGQRAIKIVEKAMLRRPPADSAESEVLSLVSHPNAVKLHEIIETSADINYVFERLDADLYSLLYKRRTVDEPTVRNIAQSVASCLSYLHALDVVHRDIKLENVLVNFATNAVKLADFGYAKVATEANRPVGTTFYQSLEILAAQSNRQTLTAAQAKASDMYALGVMLFYLLIGRPPFYVPGSDRRKFISQVRASVGPDDSRWPKDVSTACREFVCNLLSPDTEARMTAEQALLHGWAAPAQSSKHADAQTAPLAASPLVHCPA